MAERLPEKKRQKIIADYIETQNLSDSARRNGVSVEGVRYIVNSDKKVAKRLEAKKEEAVLSTLEYMNSQHETKKRILDKLLKSIEIKAEDINMLTNIKDLATAYGIIIDKELKFLETKRNVTTDHELEKVEELLGKIQEEANK